MKEISREALPLTERERQALQVLKERLLRDPRISRIILFGSTARGQWGPESDVDLLILTWRELGHAERHRSVTDAVTEVNWEYGMNFTALVVSEPLWEKGLHAISALRRDVERDGVLL